MRTSISMLSMGLLIGVASSLAHAQQAGAVRHRPQGAERRTTAHRFSAFGFGPFASTKRGNGSMMYGASYGRVWTSDDSDIRFTLLGAANSDTRHLGLGVGYGHLFDQGDISPVVGGQFGVGYDRYDKDGRAESTAGFAGGVFGGARFLRTADTQLELLLSYDQSFSSGTPGVYGLQLRILF